MSHEPPGAPAIWDTDARFVTIGEIRAAAQSKIELGAWNFLEGGAGDERTLADNVEAFDRWQFLPRLATGISRPTIGTTFLGLELRSPVVISPFGFDRMFHPDGHLAVARAAASAASVLIVPEMSSFSLEDVAAAASGPRVFQLVPMGEDDHLRRMVDRAAAAGYAAICVTLDTAMPGWRERSMTDRFAPDPMGAFGNYAPGRGMDPTVLSELVTFARPLWTWDRLSRLLSDGPLPWMAKGVLTADDARCAVDAGAAAVFVSNHGGRQLDRVPASLDALVEVVDAIAGKAEIGLDGGVRRGSDVALAIALGADVVGVGRPAAWGLAAAGEAGVRAVLDLLGAELVTTMALLGAGRIDELQRSMVRPRSQ